MKGLLHKVIPSRARNQFGARTYFFGQRSSSSAANRASVHKNFSNYHQFSLPSNTGYLYKIQHNKNKLQSFSEEDLNRYQNDYVNFIKENISNNKNSYVFSIIPTDLDHADLDRFLKLGGMFLSGKKNSRVSSTDPLLNFDEKIKPGHLSCYTEDAFVSHMRTQPSCINDAIKKDVICAINIAKNSKGSDIYFSSILVINQNLFPKVSMDELNKKALPYHVLAYPNTDNCCTIFGPWNWRHQTNMVFNNRFIKRMKESLTDETQLSYDKCISNIEQDNSERIQLRLRMNPVDFISRMLYEIYIGRFYDFDFLVEYRYKDKSVEHQFAKMLDGSIRKGRVSFRLKDFILEPIEEMKDKMDFDEYMKQYDIYKGDPKKYTKEFSDFLKNAGMDKSLFSENHGRLRPALKNK